jgi:DNA-directed RNA polymerase subunit RPC12/RpoP
VADTDEHTLTCAECGREPREDENAEDDWRTYYEGVGDGVTLCPECAGRVFGDAS